MRSCRSPLGSGLLCLFTVALPALEPVNPDLSATARGVLDYLAAGYGERCLAGYNVYAHTPDVYRQTGRYAAIEGKDLRWLDDGAAQQAHDRGIIMTIHWHWDFNGESVKTGQRETPIDWEALLTPGTALHDQMRSELAEAAVKLQAFEDLDVPVLFRPLHEIDGGWFWWTNKEDPTRTAALWRVLFDYFTEERGLDNLIWVYSAGVGKRKDAEYRRGFYPGDDWVDISGIDIYSVDVREGADDYWFYWNLMREVTPNKMLALGEGDAIPDPDKMAAGLTPAWLYAMPWWGTPTGQHPIDWAVATHEHPFIITRDELPRLGSAATQPVVGILTPADDGDAWFGSSEPQITGIAQDLDGSIDRVELYADDVHFATVSAVDGRFSHTGAPTGSYDLTAVAVDDDGLRSTSNAIRMNVGLVDLARGRPVTSSSGDAALACDGDTYSDWKPDKNDAEWLAVDLGAVQQIDRVTLVWSWKIFATSFAIDVATEDPADGGSWTTVYEEEGFDPEDWTWKVVRRPTFTTVPARWVRLRCRARRQDWGAYDLGCFEVPVPWSADLADRLPEPRRRIITLGCHGPEGPRSEPMTIAPVVEDAGTNVSHRWVDCRPWQDHLLTPGLPEADG